MPCKMKAQTCARHRLGTNRRPKFGYETKMKSNQGEKNTHKKNPQNKIAMEISYLGFIPELWGFYS